MTDLLNLNINTFKTLIDLENFQKIKIGDTNFTNVSSIFPSAYIQNTLQNRIFILTFMFLNAGLINNPYKDNTSNVSFEDITLDNVTNESFISAYKYLAKIVYSNIISNYIYLIMNYIQLDLLESMHTLNKKGTNPELSKIFEWSNSIISDIISNNYNVFTSFMDNIYQKLKSKEISEISIDDINNFIKNLFDTISIQVINSLNNYKTSTYTIEQTKILAIFERDFETFSDFREAFFVSSDILFKKIYENNQFNDSIYKYATGYFDESNKLEYKRFLTDDVSLLYKIQFILSKNIINSQSNDNYDEILNSNSLLIATSNITIQLIYTLSDCSPLLLNQLSIIEKDDGREFNFDELYKKYMTGGMLESLTKALGLAYTEYQPIIIEGLKGKLYEITHAGQNIPGVGIVFNVIKDSAGNIVNAEINRWTSDGERMTTYVVSLAAKAGVAGYSVPALMIGGVAGAAVAGLTYYYFGDVIADTVKETLGIGVKSDIGTSLPTGETTRTDEQTSTGETTILPETTLPETISKEPVKPFDVSTSLESPEMVEAREKSKVAQKQYEETDTEFKKLNAQEKDARKKQYRNEQEARREMEKTTEQLKKSAAQERETRREELKKERAFKQWERTLVSQNVPTFFESKMNEFNQFTRQQATHSLGMDSRYQTSHQLGMSPGASAPTPTPPGSSYDIESGIATINSALFLTNIGVKLWRYFKGIPDDDAAKVFVRQNLKMDYVPPPTDEFISKEIQELLSKPYERTEVPYKYFDMGIIDSPSYQSYTTPQSLYSTFDMGSPQLSYDQLPQLIADEKSGEKQEEYVLQEELLQDVPEEHKEYVRNLALYYKTKTKEGMASLLRAAILRKGTYRPGKTGTTTSLNEPNIPTADPHIISSNRNRNSPFNWFGTASDTGETTRVASESKTKYGIQSGGGVNNEFLEKIYNFIFKIVKLNVLNGQYFYIVDDKLLDSYNNIINIFSIANSISFLQNLSNINIMYQNTSKANSINNFINDNISYLESLFLKGGSLNKTNNSKSNKNKKKIIYKRTYKNKKHNKKNNSSIKVKKYKKKRKTRKI